MRPVSATASGPHQLFETTFERAPIGLCLVAPDGAFLRVNHALCELFGLDQATLLRTRFQALTHPADLAADIALLEQTLAGQRAGYEIEKRYVRSDGAIIEARLAVTLMRTPAGEPDYFISQIVDLTDLKSTQAALADWQAQTEAILDHSPLAIFLRDLDGRWQLVNRRLAETLGRDADALLGQTMALTHSSSEQTQFAADDLEVLESGSAREYDVTFADASRGGEQRHYWLQKFPVRDHDGRTIGLGGVSLDVTDRELTQRQLIAAQRRFAVAFEHAPIGKVICRFPGPGTRTEIIRCNQAFAEMLGHTAHELVGRAGVLLAHPDDHAKRDAVIAEARDGRRCQTELRIRHRDGHYVWALIAPAVIETEHGEPEMIVQALDITERKALEHQLRHLADHDALTGLYGRRRLVEELEREVSRVARTGTASALLLLDLDGFKTVNDTLGHAAGDRLLVDLAARLRDVLRQTDVVGRIGGDEFAVILPATDLVGARVAADKLIAVVRASRVTGRDGRTLSVNASVGATVLAPTRNVAAEERLIEADVAMYAAKSAGKNRCVTFAETRPDPRCGRAQSVPSLT